MRHFTVVWKRSAEADLADIWINAADRAAVTNAVQLIDVKLAESPTEWGEETRATLNGRFSLARSVLRQPGRSSRDRY
jgi:hypothetical protein